ncbi:hypothetical protein ACVOMS_10755 [Bradyrhizobium guangxiense]
MLMHESELMFGELGYERRIVAFFDVLGWRSNILEAGDEPRRIARLASVPRMFSSIVTSAASRVEGAHITSFSDNVVASIPYESAHLLWMLQSLAAIQMGAALAGFWIRGGVTIGNLHHDRDIVFGPGLNRAYFLESEVAQVPRIVLDSMVSEFADLQSDFIDSGDDPHFIDPFHAAFIERIQREVRPEKMVIDRFNELARAQVSSEPIAVPSRVALVSIFARLGAEIAAVAEGPAQDKLSWLRDRIRMRLS